MVVWKNQNQSEYLCMSVIWVDVENLENPRTVRQVLAQTIGDWHERPSLR